MTYPITIQERDEVGNRKTMTTSANLYGDGRLVIETDTQSRHATEGLRGRVCVICVDGQGRASWVSQEYTCTTRGSVLDLFTPSRGRDVFQEQLPAQVAQVTRSLDVLHSSGPLTDFRQQLIANIKTTVAVAEELKPILDLLV